MNKKTIILVLIFSLFLTISHVSALDADNLIVDDNDPIGSDINLKENAVSINAASSNDDGNTLVDLDSNEEKIIDVSRLAAGDEDSSEMVSNDEDKAISNGMIVENDDALFNETNDNPNYLNVGNALTSSDLDSNILRAGNTIYVSPDGTGSGSSSDDPTNWANAYSIATSDDVIYFLDGSYNIVNFNIGKNLILQAVNAGSAIINPNGAGRAFNAGLYNLTLIGLKFINGNTSGNGGAVTSSRGTISAINCTFINNTAGSSGGALYSGTDMAVDGCEFINNTASSNGGAVYSYGSLNTSNSNFENNFAKIGGAAYSYKNGSVENSNFTNNSANTGGAVYGYNDLEIADSNFNSNNALTGMGGAVCADNVEVDNSNFTNNVASGSGGALRAVNNSYINNSNFVNNTSINAQGGAAYSRNNYINNSAFENNSAKNGGGAVYSNEYFDIDNSLFEDNHVSSNGGAVSSYRNGTVTGSNFTGNSADQRGGAVYTGQEIVVDNSNFNDNHAEKDGGAIYTPVKSTVTDSNFNNNSAEVGGALSAITAVLNGNNFTNNHVNASGGAVDSIDVNSANNNYINNSAQYYGGAILTSEINSQNDNFINNSVEYNGGAVYAYEASIENSSFDSNTAVNGGGLFATDSNVNNSNFTNNNAYDGSAIISGNLVLNNSYFENNTSQGYGVIYADNATIENNDFTGNSAAEDKQIYVLNELNESNNSLDPSQIEDVQGTPIQVEYVNTTTYLVDLEDGLQGYCLQRTLSFPDVVYMIDNLTLARNQLTGEDVSEYLKILIYKYYFSDERDNISFSLWDFTDGDFRNSNRTMTQEVIDLYDSGFRVPDFNASLILENGTQVLFDFYTAGSSTTQNLFLFNITYMGNNSNLTVEKITLNQTVLNGEQVEFIIRVTNNGDMILHDVTVVEENYDGLIYDSYRDENNLWRYENGRWIYKNQLNINETVEFTVVFNTTKSGNFTNVVVADSNETDNKTTNNTTSVFTPGLNIEKISNNQTVKVGDNVVFTIVVTNTGDCNLTGVYIKDNEYSNGLKYISYKGSDWTFDGVDTWTYNGVLAPGESASLDVIFKALTEGMKVNTAIAGHNLTNETVNSTNKTNVTKDSDNGTNNTENPEDPKDNTTLPKKIVKESVPVMAETGNPLLVLLISMVLILVSPKRNK